MCCLISHVVEPLYFKNFDLQNMITPVKPAMLQKLLNETSYNPVKTKYLVDGFTEGFEIGYEGPTDIQMVSENLELNGLGDRVTLWNKVMKEVKLKRYAGPFTSIPYKNYIQSPIGLVPKDNGKDVRLIFHLSHPRKGTESVNFNTPKEKCRVRYPEFSKAIELCLAAGRSCKLSKSDFKSAFCNVGLKSSQWKWLIMKADSPFNRKTYFFVDKCLPFWASISCAMFQAISDAVAHIVKVRARKDNINYLDDFLFVALLRAFCEAQLDLFLNVCDQIGMPVSLEKTFRSSTQMIFLGFLIDTVRQIIMIPTEKLEKGRKLIETVLSKASKKITVKQLQKICGFLNFLGRCIIPGRAFTRRLYNPLGNNKLKPHHHIRINLEMRADLSMWQTFLCHPSSFARGFLDTANQIQADTIAMASDPSKGKTLGFGAICQDSWTFGQWPEGFIEIFDLSIAYLELFALVVGVKLWINRFANKQIVLFCDNQSVVAMVNSTTSSCKNCMILIRILVLECLYNNVRVFARYIKSADNKAPDYLSRLKFDSFRALKSSWEAEPTPILENLWPIMKCWRN